METINVLYRDEATLKDTIQQYQAKQLDSLLIRVHTCIHTTETIKPLLSMLHTALPQATIIGGSHNAIIYHGEILEQECLISFTSLPHVNIQAKLFDTQDVEPLDLAERVRKQELLQQSEAAIVLFSSTYHKVGRFIKACDSFTKHVKMVGGIACDTEDKTLRKGTPAFVCLNEEISPHGVVIAALQSEQLIAYGNAICGVEQIGQTYSITKADDLYVEEINEQDASSWYRSLLDEHAFAKDHEISKVFPFVLPEEQNTVRTIFYDEEKNKIHWVDNPDSPQIIRLAFCSPHETIKEAREICEDLQEIDAQSIFVYSCCVRNEIMNKCSTWELSPFKDTKISGALCAGEICHIHGRNVYSNCTCSLLTLSLQEGKLPIHMEALDDVEDLGFDNQHILTYLLKSTSDDMYKTNASLSKQIIEQNNQMLEALFSNQVTKLANMTKYLYDRNHLDFNKVCIINTQNASMLRTHYGDELCNKELIQKVKRCRDFLNDPELYFYQYSQDCIMICALTEYDDELFLSKMKELSTYLGTVESREKGFFYVNEFALVIHESELLEKAELTLSYIERSDQRFLLYYPNLGLESEVEEELKCLSNIKYAVLHDGVEPYFQPIHDNQLHEIVKYEALMRLRTPDGNILYPNQFLDTAKKFKLYEDLSRQMIAKVMNLYRDSLDSVSINLSVQDIYSDETKALIYSQLQQTKTPHNIIFEIVESEEIHRDNILEDFIRRIRQLGAKIAIDDFGSGYSNLLKLVKLDADYIKIDGEIIRNMLQDETCRKILDTILFLSKQTHTELIAEFVENDLIQHEIEHLGIRFSQGYHFSKPKPYDCFPHHDKVD